MNRINRKVEYALMALKHMASKRQGQLTSAKEVVEVTGVPFDATARVLQLMAQAGWLKSEHGAHGGYTIVKDLSRVSMLQLMELILGEVETVKCLADEKSCELRASCNVLTPMSRLRSRLLGFYSELMLSDLLEVGSTEVPL